ncbi:DUF3732 domain-containing protein [Streptomyces sp. NPDC005969]|uniref:DUF3732 domain-containing protein n=1 Tax=Streptomyces sp. NPDC005969 TaxID=3156722 RepID=UPI0033E35615
MKLTWARAAWSHPALSGVSRAHFGELSAELASAWEAARQSALREARGGERRRAEGAGRKPKLVFLDRLLITLVHLRHQLPHVVLAELFEVDRSTVSAAIRQVRPLLAARGFAVPDRPGLRLKTLEDVFAYAEAEDVELRLDGAETQVRRPQADRLGEARREVRTAQRKLDAALRQREVLDTNGIALLRLAQSEGLLSDVPAAPDANTVYALLRKALTVPPLAPVSSDIGDRRQELHEERRTLRAQLQEFDAALATVDRWQRRSFDFTGELHLQVDRLKTLDLLGPERDHNTDVCPMCTQPLEHPDPSARDIARLTSRLSEELEQAAGVQPVRQEHLRALQAQRDGLAERLKTNGSLLKELMANDENMARLQEQHLRAAHLQGRIAQSLAQDRRPTDDASQLRNALASTQEVVSILEEHTANDDVPAETERRLADIAAEMTPWARRLKLGQSEEPNEAGISFKQLSVVIRRPHDRLPQERVGSAKNYIGYHLVAHLALHTYLRRHHRPVPGFLALDQPTQAFFPSKPRDASTVPDADWSTVTEYFRLLHEVAELNEGDLQIIVCDHANLPDDWFQEALIGNWRPDDDGTRNALIPPRWLT